MFYPTVTRLVIFDMDGTLTRAVMDFARIRREIQAAIGIHLGEPLLDAMRRLQGEVRRIAFSLMERFEDEAAANATLNEGVIETLEALRVRGVRPALMTNNRLQSVETVTGKFGLKFDCIYHRDSGPTKPDPRCVRRILDLMQTPAREALVVGDWKWDILAGQGAGVRTCLYLKEGPNPFADVRPDHIIRAIPEVLGLL